MNLEDLAKRWEGTASIYESALGVAVARGKEICARELREALAEQQAVSPGSSWRPATKTCALEMFEVPCCGNDTQFWFYAPNGEQARVDVISSNSTIAVECSPEDRKYVIEMLSNLLNLMKSAG